MFLLITTRRIVWADLEVGSGNKYVNKYQLFEAAVHTRVNDRATSEFKYGMAMAMAVVQYPR